MDVVSEDQALVAERAGAVAVMVLERVPSDILKYGIHLFYIILKFLGGVARMPYPEIITRTQNLVQIPIMAKVRIGHSMEAEVKTIDCKYLKQDRFFNNWKLILLMKARF